MPDQGEPGAGLPAGTVTFLLTDIEGSTRLWEALPDAMEVALEQHDRLLAELNGEAWPAGAALRVRMGLHTGEARARDADHIDHAPVNRCARVKAAAHGGQ